MKGDRQVLEARAQEMQACKREATELARQAMSTTQEVGAQRNRAMSQCADVCDLVASLKQEIHELKMENQKLKVEAKDFNYALLDTNQLSALKAKSKDLQCQVAQLQSGQKSALKVQKELEEKNKELQCQVTQLQFEHDSNLKMQNVELNFKCQELQCQVEELQPWQDRVRLKLAYLTRVHVHQQAMLHKRKHMLKDLGVNVVDDPLPTVKVEKPCNLSEFDILLKEVQREQVAAKTKKRLTSL